MTSLTTREEPLATAAGAPRRLRVLLLLTSTAGGAGLHNYQLAREMCRREFDLTVAYGPGYPLDEDFEKLDVPVRILSMSRKISPFVNARGYAQIRRLLRENDFDIVCTSCSIAGMMGRIAAALARVPVRLHIILVYASQPNQHPAKVPIYRWIERALDRLTTRYVAVTKAAGQYGIDTKIMREEKVDVIYMATDDAGAERRPRDEMRRELGLEPHQRVVMAVGRCEWQKGFDYFLETAALVVKTHPEAVFVIVGDGPLLEELQAQARELGVQDAVRFTGWRNDVRDVIGAADIFCLSSRWETFGLVIAEAMAAAVPVVATRLDCVPEVVAEGETALLVPPADPAALADGIRRFLDDPDLARRMGVAGRQRVETTFSVDGMVRQYEDLFRRLVADASTPFASTSSPSRANE